jgi:uncharacterized membrane protein
MMSEKENELLNAPHRSEFEEKLRSVVYIVGTLAGFVILILGFLVLQNLVEFAWEFLNQPGTIDKFALAFQKDSKLIDSIDISFFRMAAWLLVILMLLVIGKVGAWIIGAGINLVKK